MHTLPPSTVGMHIPPLTAHMPFAQQGVPSAPHVVQLPAVQPHVGDAAQVPVRLSFRQQPPLSHACGVQHGWSGPPQAVVHTVPPPSVSKQTMCGLRHVSPP
jgi:hypothetical protein